MKSKLACLVTSSLICASLADGANAAVSADGISLELSPRVCTLSSDQENCDTVVTARWRAPQDESLCLLIVGQPQVRQCWENHAEGVYTVPHFDFHFYWVSLADRDAVDPGDPEFAAKARNLPTDGYVPPGYIVPGDPAEQAVHLAHEVAP